MVVQASRISRPTRSSAVASPARTPLRSMTGIRVTDGIGWLLPWWDVAGLMSKKARRIPGCIYRQFESCKLQCSDASSLTKAYGDTGISPLVFIFSMAENSRYILPRMPRRSTTATTRDDRFATPGDSHEYPCRLEESCARAGTVRGKRSRPCGRSTREGEEGGRTGRRHGDAVRAVRLPRKRPASGLQQGPVRRDRQGDRREGALHRPAVAERAAGSRSRQVRHGRRPDHGDEGAHGTLYVHAARSPTPPTPSSSAPNDSEHQAIVGRRRQDGRRRARVRRNSTS